LSKCNPVLEMKFKFVLLFIPFFIFVMSCGEQKPPIEQEVIPIPKKVESKFDTSGISKEVFQMMLKEGDHIDIIFNHLDVGMNQDGNQALYQDLQYISSRPLKSLATDCTPLARKIYIGKGEIIMEGDLYYGPECYFQVFIKDGVELYGNYLTPQGVQFVDKLLEQIKASKPGQ